MNAREPIGNAAVVHTTSTERYQPYPDSCLIVSGARCSCGWRAREWRTSILTAERDATEHARICTDCKTGPHDILHSDTWMRGVQVVGRDERLCNCCYAKRGVPSLRQLNDEAGRQERAKRQSRIKGRPV